LYVHVTDKDIFVSLFYINTQFPADSQTKEKEIEESRKSQVHKFLRINKSFHILFITSVILRFYSIRYMIYVLDGRK